MGGKVGLARHVGVEIGLDLAVAVCGVADYAEVEGLSDRRAVKILSCEQLSHVALDSALVIVPLRLEFDEQTPAEGGGRL